MVLRNGGDDTFKTKISDVLNQELYKDRSLITQDYKMAQAFINGEYWGVYILQERIDKETISDKVNLNPEDIVLIKKQNVIDDDQILYDDFLNLLSFIENNDMSVSLNYEYVKNKMDVQSYIDLRCFEIYTNRSDGTNNNYNNVAEWKIIKEGKDIDSKYNFILYDTENDTDYEYADIIWNPVFTSLLKNEEFKKQFIISYMDVINHNFEYKKVHELIEELKNKIELSVVESHKRFIRENYSLDDYHNELNKLDGFYKNEKERALNSLIKDLGIKEPMYKISIINNKNVDYTINTINTNSNFEGEYFSTYPIKASSENDNVIGWKVNDELIKEKSIEITLNKDTNIEIILK